MNKLAIEKIFKKAAKKDSIIKYNGEWLKVIESDGYEFVEETKTLTATVVWRDTAKGIEFYLRNEYRPPLGIHVGGAIGGTVDENESPLETAIREVKEETGFIVNKDDIRPLGGFYVSTNSNTYIFLFAAYISEITPFEEPEGDGSIWEEMSTGYEWINENDIYRVEDPRFVVAAGRLLNILENN